MKNLNLAKGKETILPFLNQKYGCKRIDDGLFKESLLLLLKDSSLDLTKLYILTKNILGDEPLRNCNVKEITRSRMSSSRKELIERICSAYSILGKLDMSLTNILSFYNASSRLLFSTMTYLRIKKKLDYNNFKDPSIEDFLDIDEKELLKMGNCGDATIEEYRKIRSKIIVFMELNK